MKKKTDKTTKSTMDDIFDELNKKYDGVYRGTQLVRQNKISTGSVKLDRELKGGYVKGKIIEIFGPESCGKTTLAFAMLARSQGINGFIDAETVYERETAEMHGVDTSQLIVQQPEYLEKGMEMVLDMVRLGAQIIVYDSIAGGPTKTELEGSMEDHNVGKKPYRIGQLMRKSHLAVSQAGCTLFYVNQIRDSMSMYGSPINVPGGHALKFHASYRLWIKSVTQITMGSESAKKVIGHYMKVNVKKNKIATPGADIMVPLIYGYGISREWEILDLAEEAGIIVKSGSWYSYNDTKLGQGQYNVFTFLLDNPELVDEIESKL